MRGASLSAQTLFAIHRRQRERSSSQRGSRLRPFSFTDFLTSLVADLKTAPLIRDIRFLLTNSSTISIAWPKIPLLKESARPAKLLARATLRRCTTRAYNDRDITLINSKPSALAYIFKLHSRRRTILRETLTDKNHGAIRGFVQSFGFFNGQLFHERQQSARR